MSEKFNLEIVTPDKLFLKSEVTEVVIPSFEGELGILKDHIPLITFLRPGVISVKNNEIEKYFIEEGTVEFSNNNLLILTSEVKNIKDIDRKFVDEIILKSEKNIANPDISDKDKYLLSYTIETLKEIRN
tara:strand:+ start:97 stop:486 length:390 start_codon:yes stop_codon:yes gene_type:complete